MGGFFGAVSKRDVIEDVFFGTDYHSHLGTRRGGMAAFDKEIGLQRDIHNIQNTPFRTKFEKIFEDMKGNSAIGCISDYDPQPLLIRSSLGAYAICVIGIINNADALIDRYLQYSGGHFGAMTGGAVNSTELVAALINQKSTFVEGIQFAQKEIEGTASILILKGDGAIIAARDKVGRLPILIGKDEDGYCVSFESFAYQKLGYEAEKELGPGEIVEITADEIKVLDILFELVRCRRRNLGDDRADGMVRIDRLHLRGQPVDEPPHLDAMRIVHFHLVAKCPTKERGMTLVLLHALKDLLLRLL